MGDSYSAGNGAGSYVSPGPRLCYRSSKNYARQFERAIEKSQRTFVENAACSGAVIDDISNRQADRNVAPQIDAVNKGYDVVFLTLGGNDLNFSSIVQNCLIKFSDDAEKCDADLTFAENELGKGRIAGSLELKLENALTSIKNKLDRRSKIVLLGYPYLERDSSYTIQKPKKKNGQQGDTVRVGSRVRSIGDRGDIVQARVISSLNSQLGNRFVYVPTKKLFAGQDPRATSPGAFGVNHELSAATQPDYDRWFIEPFVDVGGSFGAIQNRPLFYHPNERGWNEEGLLLARTSAVPTRDLNSGPEPAAPQCDDGIDNNGDGKTDFPSDPSCTDRDDDTEDSPVVPCNSQQISGGEGVTTTVHDLGRSSGTFTFDYDAYSVPDQFDIVYEGKTIYSTGGQVSGSASVQVPFSGKSTQATVTVTGPSGTAWVYTLGCPTSSAPAMARAAARSASGPVVTRRHATTTKRERLKKRKTSHGTVRRSASYR